ncbi:hypothetical protein [Microbulbifer sp. MCCC 1A16149]|uniref:hypothetical protein n=1 Tax=Microbulbifer sp. MCCC 1A16149 TaxID=3411322 RepID=UPI003D0F182F
MNKVIAFFLVCVSFHAEAWECSNENRYKQSIGAHADQATDVFLGQVVSGTYDPNEKYGNETEITVAVNHSFKGENGKLVTLVTGFESLFQGVTLGESYVFFLFSDRELTFCRELIPVGPSTRSLEDLKEMSNRVDVHSGSKIKHLLHHFGNLP